MEVKDLRWRESETGPRVARPSPMERNCWQLATTLHHQIIFHLKDIGNAVGAQAGKVLVCFAIDDALKADMPIFHYDVNRRHGRPPVFRQRWVAVDGVIQRAAQLVIHRSWGKHFNIVGDPGHALDTLHGRFRVMLERGIRDLALERDVIAVHFESEIIENRVIRKQKKLVPYFADYILTGLCFLTAGCCIRRRYSSGGKKKREQ